MNCTVTPGSHELSDGGGWNCGVVYTTNEGKLATDKHCGIQQTDAVHGQGHCSGTYAVKIKDSTVNCNCTPD